MQRQSVLEAGGKPSTGLRLPLRLLFVLAGLLLESPCVVLVFLCLCLLVGLVVGLVVVAVWFGKPLGASWAPLGGLLGVSWRILEALRNLLRTLGGSWEILGGSLGFLGSLRAS